MLDKQEEQDFNVKAYRKRQLDDIDINIEKLKKYIQDNPGVLPEIKGDLIVPLRIVNKGSRMTVRIVSNSIELFGV